ncbi:hypothetical protein KM043_010159 [Ampulex compressa]|nr:hypothetical protein KM043_010159 [Ampulex compressa]
MIDLKNKPLPFYHQQKQSESHPPSHRLPPFSKPKASQISINNSESIIIPPVQPHFRSFHESHRRSSRRWHRALVAHFQFPERTCLNTLSYEPRPAPRSSQEPRNVHAIPYKRSAEEQRAKQLDVLSKGSLARGAKGLMEGEGEGREAAADVQRVGRRENVGIHPGSLRITAYLFAPSKRTVVHTRNYTPQAESSVKLAEKRSIRLDARELESYRRSVDEVRWVDEVGRMLDEVVGPVGEIRWAIDEVGWTVDEIGGLVDEISPVRLIS